jgi:hypothetical protein
MEPSASRDASPPRFGSVKPNIADKVKGNSRAAKKPKSTMSSQQGSPAPTNTEITASRGKKRTVEEEDHQYGVTKGVRQELSGQPGLDKKPISEIDDVGDILEETPMSELMEMYNNVDKKAADDALREGNMDFDFNAMSLKPDDLDKLGQLSKAEADSRKSSNAKPNHPTAAKKAKKKSQKKAAANKPRVSTKEERKAIEMRTSPISPVASEDEESESDDGGEYCICRGPDDHRKMIACDQCEEWYHCSCINLKEADVDLIDKYICNKCKIPDIRYTTWKPACRVQGCNKPARVHISPPSKYCSDEHRMQFFRKLVHQMPDGPSPSRGGALTKGELKGMLDQTAGNVKAFHALGSKPTLSTDAASIDWSKILTNEEKGRLCEIKIQRLELDKRSAGFKDREKLIRMAMDRLKKVTEGNKEMTGICGWDPRLAMNEEEFAAWRGTEAGKKAFDSGVLDKNYCGKKKCPRHTSWIKLNIQDTRFEDVNIQKSISKLRVEEAQIQDRAKLREATK